MTDTTAIISNTGTAFRNLPADAQAVEVDKLARRLVETDVRYCVSGMVAALIETASAGNLPDAISYDSLVSLGSRDPDADDFREALEYSDHKGRLTVTRGEGVWHYATTDADGDPEDEGQGYDETEAGAWRAGFDSLGIDHPDGTECLEHWLVGDRLASDLRDAGEAVVTDLAGLTVWGRCTSGQAIYADAVLQRIARDILEA